MEFPQEKRRQKERPQLEEELVSWRLPVLTACQSALQGEAQTRMGQWRQGLPLNGDHSGVHILDPLVKF